MPESQMKEKKSSSVTLEWEYEAKIYHEYLRKAIPDIMAVWIKKPVALACICAKEYVASRTEHAVGLLRELFPVGTDKSIGSAADDLIALLESLVGRVK